MTLRFLVVCEIWYAIQENGIFTVVLL